MGLKFSNSQEFLNKLQLYINAFIAIPMLGFIILFLKIENRAYNPEFLGEEITFYFCCNYYLNRIWPDTFQKKKGNPGFRYEYQG